MRFVFRYTDRFVKSAAKIFSEEELRALELYLAANPEAGDVIPGGHGLRKVRFASKKQGKGKRGGARLIYLRIVDRFSKAFSQIEMFFLGEVLARFARFVF